MLAIWTALAGACAGRAGPAHFPARSVPAYTTTADDEALMAAGFIELGPLEATVEKDRCRGNAGAPTNCSPADRSDPSVMVLLTKAAAKGGDVVRIDHYETPTTAPWIESDCDLSLSEPYRVLTKGGWEMSPADPVCGPREKTVGIKHLVLSDGTVWRRAPALVPNMRLARAVAAGDEAGVQAALPEVAALDTYLAEPPLLVAVRRGHAGILRRLLDAGAKAGRDAALLVAIERADEAAARALLAAGVSPEVADPVTRERALHVATRRRASLAIVKLLLDAGADVNTLNAVDQMPLQCALLSCDVPTATLLIAAHADKRWARADAVGIGLARGICPAETEAIVRLLVDK